MLDKERDPASKDRLKRLEKDLALLQEKADALTATWKSEKDKLSWAAKLQTRQGQERSRRCDPLRRLPARRRIAVQRHPAAREQPEIDRTRCQCRRHRLAVTVSSASKPVAAQFL
jgi:hypothetical protein